MEEQGGGWLPDWLKPDWKVIEGAPRAFLVSVIVTSGVFVFLLYSGFKVNLELKTDRITELTAAIASLKEENDKLKNAPKASIDKASNTGTAEVDYKEFMSQPIETVLAHQYRNEIVDLDGKNFVNCFFESVTFRYLGKKPFRFSGINQIKGISLFETDNPAVGLFHQFFSKVREDPNGQFLGMTEVDKKTGRERLILNGESKK